MKLSDKIILLRKRNGWSQEELAEKLDVSRQAVSRWEGGIALPDAANLLQLSRLFGVTADYLLNDAFESDEDLPKVRQVRGDGAQQAVVLLVTLEVMIVLLQFMSAVVLKSEIFTLLSFLPFAAVLGGFEIAWQKKGKEQSTAAAARRRKVYIFSAWLGLYFPIRFAASLLAGYYPRPYSPVALEGTVLLIYCIAAGLITLRIIKKERKVRKDI